MRREVPEPWAAAMIAAGMTDPRSSTKPSWSALGRTVGSHASTLIAMADGSRATSQELVDSVADVLHIDRRSVAQWVGRARTVRDPYRPPSDVHLLDRDERDAVSRLIVLMARSKKEVHDGTAAEAQKSTNDGGGPTVGDDDPPASVTELPRPGQPAGVQRTAARKRDRPPPEDSDQSPS